MALSNSSKPTSNAEKIMSESVKHMSKSTLAKQTKATPTGPLGDKLSTLRRTSWSLGHELSTLRKSTKVHPLSVPLESTDPPPPQKVLSGTTQTFLRSPTGPSTKRPSKPSAVVVVPVDAEQQNLNDKSKSPPSNISEFATKVLDAEIVSTPGHASPQSPNPQSATDRIKDFAKRETNNRELKQKLREAELASYREDLVFQRRLMLFLAYAMASVFTALSLWVVCFVVLYCVTQ